MQCSLTIVLRSLQFIQVEFNSIHPTLQLLLPLLLSYLTYYYMVLCSLTFCFYITTINSNIYPPLIQLPFLPVTGVHWSSYYCPIYIPPTNGLEFMNHLLNHFLILHCPICYSESNSDSNSMDVVSFTGTAWAGVWVLVWGFPVPVVFLFSPPTPFSGY